MSLVRRVGIWAIVQALPDEAALRGYLRAAYLGVSVVVIGSVLAGAALAAGMVAFYGFLDDRLPGFQAFIFTSGASILVILGCFYLAGHWFQKLLNIKQDMSIFNDVGKDVFSSAVNSLAEGFLEGMVLPTRDERSSRTTADDDASFKRRTA